MKQHQDLFENAGESFEYGKLYIQKQLQLLRLETSERIAKSASNLIALGVVAAFVFLALVMFTIAVGFWLTSILGSEVTAFFIVSGFYLLLAGIVYIFKNNLITNPVLNIVLDSILD
ncbi:MAG: phage holin family protein [Chitinophagales bacterium]|nr:phage holin family protein [Chitinophagales bacterium]